MIGDRVGPQDDRVCPGLLRQEPRNPLLSGFPGSGKTFPRGGSEQPKRLLFGCFPFAGPLADLSKQPGQPGHLGQSETYGTQTSDKVGRKIKRADIQHLAAALRGRRMKRKGNVPDYITYPDTAEAQVIWGYRQRDADAALAHLEAAAVSLAAAREILWRFNKWPRIATESGRLHTQVYSLIGRVAAKRRKPGKRPAIPPPGDGRQP